MILALTDASAMIIATAITAFGTLIGILVKAFINFSQENKKDHDRVSNILIAVDTKLDHMHNDINFVKDDVAQVRDAFNDHLAWHLNTSTQAVHGGPDVAHRSASHPAAGEQEDGMPFGGDRP